MDLVKEIKNVLEDGKIEMSEIVKIIPHVMQVVEKYTDENTTGAEKQKMVIDAFKQVIEETNLLNKDKLKISCDTILPPIIDAIIAASKGQFELNNNVRTLCNPCFNLFGK